MAVIITIVYSQSRIFFSSGTAQMNGGGLFCIDKYSCKYVRGSLFGSAA